jgi:hypothetical protein
MLVVVEDRDVALPPGALDLKRSRLLMPQVDAAGGGGDGLRRVASRMVARQLDVENTSVSATS